jgi:Flp pilus assembly protein TadG
MRGRALDVKMFISGTISRRKARFRRVGRRRSFGDGGQALVEVAIALPILLALLVGIFEFARAYNVQQVITNAAREGAREGVLPDKTTSDVQTVVTGRLADANISTATIAITPDPLDDTVKTGTAVSVQVSVNYTFVFIGPILRMLDPGATDPGTITLRSTATMRKE